MAEMRFLAIVVSAVLLCTGCSQQSKAAVIRISPTNDSLANGRAIYRTGKDLNGTRISANPKPLRKSCIQCHLANGAGGVHLPGDVVSANLRQKALVSGTHPYTIQLVERAISTGIDNEGKHLDPMMPRWHMSSRDLHDVAQYVLTQLK